MTPLRTPVRFLGRTTAFAFSFAAIVVASGGASNTQPVEVRLFPSGESRDTEQIRLEFSSPVVVPSQKQLSAPAAVDSRCGAGAGTWLDEKTWAFTFQEPVRGGLLCEVSLDPKFAAQKNVVQSGVLAFNTGGPAVEDTRPFEFGPLDEDTVLAVRVSAMVEKSSISRHVKLVAEGIASPILVTPFEPSQVQIERIFRYDDTLKSAYKARRVVFLRPSTTLPPGRKVSLFWGAGVRSAESGIATQRTQELTFQVRSPFQYRVECPRENARSGCVPLSPLDLVFNAEVSWEKASQIKLIQEGSQAEEKRPQWEVGLSPLSSVSRVTFAAPLPPGSLWRVEFPKDFRDDSGRELEALPRSSFQVRIGPVPVLAKLQGPFGVVESSDPVVPLSVRALEKEVSLRELRLSPSQLARDPAAAFRWHSRVQEAKRESSLFLPNEKTKTRKLQIPEAKTDVQVVGLPRAGRGLHVLELRSQLLGKTLLDAGGPFHVASATLVTDLALHLKTGRTQGLAWLTSLSTAQPVQGAQIAVVDCMGHRLPGKFTTNKEGFVTFPLPKRSSCEKETRLFWSGVGVVATHAGDATFTHSSWDMGLERWRFHSESASDPGLSLAWGDESAEPSAGIEERQPIAAVLSSPLLRAGETLHVALSAWAPTSGRKEISKLPRRLEIRHLGSGEALEFPVLWTQDGSAKVDITLPHSLKRGGYDVALVLKKNEKKSLALVRIEDFKVPTSRAFLKFSEAHFWKKNSELKGHIQIDYLSGGSAAHKEVDVLLSLTPENGRSLPGSRGYIFATHALSPGLRRTDDVETESRQDTPGAKRVRLSEKGDTTVAARVTTSEAVFVHARLEARYSDFSGVRSHAAQTKTLAPASSVVGISTRSDVALEGHVTLRGKVVDPDGHPVPGAKVTFAAASRENYSIRKKILGGFYAYESYVKVGTPVDVCQGTTDAKGLVSCSSWKAAQGTWSVEARHVSKEGITTRAVSEFTVYGNKPQWFPGDDSDRMSVVPDKKIYQPGEQARLRVESPFQKATALVTIEAGDVLEARVVDFHSARPFLTVPVKPSHAPNVKVGVLLQRPRLKTKTHRPGPGEVDLAKPSVRLGLAALQVERSEQTLQVELRTNATEYAVRQKGTARVHVRDASGAPPPKGTLVTVFALDEALLELENNTTPDVLAQLLPRRSHSVDTATTLSFLFGRRHFGQKARPAGGGGGRLSTRELFDTLLFWQPHVPVDAQGRAEVPFQLGDSLTKFRIFASAVSPAARKAGYGETTIVSRQDILLLPQVPLVVRENDTFDAAFLVRNTSAHTLTFEPRFEVQHAQMENKAFGPVTLAPGQDSSLSVSLHANTKPRGKETSDEPPPAIAITLKLLKAAQGASSGTDVLDAMRTQVPVHRGGRLRTVTSNVHLLSPRTPVQQIFRHDKEDSKSTLFLSIASAGVGDVLKLSNALKDSSYTGTEQLFAKAVVGETKSNLLWSTFVRELSSHRMDEKGLATSFPGEKSGDPHLTATMLVAAKAWNNKFPKETEERLFGALRESLAPRAGVNPVSFSTRVLALEALARHAQPVSQSEATLTVTPERLLWTDFISLLSAALSAREAKKTNPATAAFFETLAKPGATLLAALPQRLTRAGGLLDLRAESGLEGSRAQAARAKLLVVLLEARANGVLTPEEEASMASIVVSIGRAHALNTAAIKSPSNQWSVWGLLAARHMLAHALSPQGNAHFRNLSHLRYAWALTPEGSPAIAKGFASPFGSTKPFQHSIALTRPTTYTLSVQPDSLFAKEKATDALPEALLFTHAQTPSPVTAPEHRGLRVSCSLSVPQAPKVSVSADLEKTITLAFAVAAQSPKEGTVLDVPLPPGAHILEVRPRASAAYVEKTALGVRLWYDSVPVDEASASGEVSFVLGSKGRFVVPGCHAHTAEEPDVSSTLPPVEWWVR